jgi:hypothetical protein
VNVSELKILVIGGASLNTLQGAENFVPGGAGMYTTMSAHRSGAKVTLYAPRPVPMPNALLAVNAGLTWLGPEIAVERSGKRMGAVDWFFFQARRRCPEMTEPLCEQCAVHPACAHRKSLFQPVRRSSFY